MKNTRTEKSYPYSCKLICGGVPVNTAAAESVCLRACPRTSAVYSRVSVFAATAAAVFVVATAAAAAVVFVLANSAKMFFRSLLRTARIDTWYVCKKSHYQPPLPPLPASQNWIGYMSLALAGAVDPT